MSKKQKSMQSVKGRGASKRGGDEEEAEPARERNEEVETARDMREGDYSKLQWSVRAVELQS